MAEAKRDGNFVTTLLGVSNVDGVTPVVLYADPVTHRLLVDFASGSGTVTSVSVVSANGFAGTVATATTTPAITLSTTITGVLYGNGTAISALTIGSGLSLVGTTLSATGGGITIGTTTITSGTDTRILYNNAGVVGEYTLTGSGTVVVMATAPTFVTSITTPSVLATANDSGALGASGTAFSDLFLASGGVINFAASNVTLTHSSGILTQNAGEFRITSANVGTNADSVPTLSSTSTITNKRNQPRIVSAASYTTDTGTSLDVSTTDIFVITAQAGALLFNAPSGTPVQGEKLIIRIKDNGTARALTWNAVFRAMGTALPSTTVLSKTLYLGFFYNSTDTKWDLVASAQEA